MIVRTKRPTRYLAIDTVLTGSAWLAFLYLFTKGVVVVAFGPDTIRTIPVLGIELGPTATTLMIYLVICTFNALLIVIWVRAQKRAPRKAQRQLTDHSLASDLVAQHFQLSADQLEQVQDSRVTVIYHSPVGGITHLETDCLQLEEVRMGLQEPRVRAA